MPVVPSTLSIRSEDEFFVRATLALLNARLEKRSEFAAQASRNIKGTSFLLDNAKRDRDEARVSLLQEDVEAEKVKVKIHTEAANILKKAIQIIEAEFGVQSGENR